MKKQLIPAIAMALLGATALGGSTFAWFSANSSAAATGLQISAKASSSLLISNTSGSGWAASTTLSAKNSPNQNMEPVTIDEAAASTTEVSFKKLTTTDKQNVLPDGKIKSDYNPVYEATTKDYVKSAVYLLYSGDATKHVDVTCTLSMDNNADEIWKAVHVALYSVGSKTVVEDFVFDGTDGGLGVAVAGTGFDVQNNVEKGFDVYVWVEGTDTDCKNSNAMNGDSYAVAFAFTVEDTAE